MIPSHSFAIAAPRDAPGRGLQDEEGAGRGADGGPGAREDSAPDDPRRRPRRPVLDGRARGRRQGRAPGRLRAERRRRVRLRLRAPGEGRPARVRRPRRGPGRRGAARAPTRGRRQEPVLPAALLRAARRAGGRCAHDALGARGPHAPRVLDELLRRALAEPRPDARAPAERRGDALPRRAHGAHLPPPGARRQLPPGPAGPALQGRVALGERVAAESRRERRPDGQWAASRRRGDEGAGNTTKPAEAKERWRRIE